MLIEGRLQTSKYKNKYDVEITATDIVIENAEFAGSKKKAANNFDGTPIDNTLF